MSEPLTIKERWDLYQEERKSRPALDSAWMKETEFAIETIHRIHGPFVLNTEEKEKVDEHVRKIGAVFTKAEPV